jgi:hypothetical protein
VPAARAALSDRVGRAGSFKGAARALSVRVKCATVANCRTSPWATLFDNAQHPVDQRNLFVVTDCRNVDRTGQHTGLGAERRVDGW